MCFVSVIDSVLIDFLGSRYKKGPLINFVMEHLGVHDTSFLERLDEHSSEWRCMHHAICNVRVAFKTASGYPHEWCVHDICTRARRWVFSLEDCNGSNQAVQITVSVGYIAQTHYSCSFLTNLLYRIIMLVTIIK